MRRRPSRRLLALVVAAGLTGCSPAPIGGRPDAIAGPAGPALVAPAPAPAATELTPAAAVAASPPAAEPALPVALRLPAGVVVPVLGREGDAWTVSTPCGREAVLPTATPIALDGPVVLDPGHGGYDPGAVGPNGLAESELNLAVALYAAAALEAAGVPTVLTRNGDYGMNLTNRAKLAVGLHAQAFVSIHHNAAAWAPSTIPGSEAYHQVSSAESKRLAGLVYEEVVAALSAYDVGWVTSGAGVTWRTKANGDDWYAMVNQPRGVNAALEELAFLSNPPEADLLADPGVQRVEGEAVARGILRFLTTGDPGSGYVEGGQMPPRPRPGGPRTGGGGIDSECDDPVL